MTTRLGKTNCIRQTTLLLV